MMNEELQRLKALALAASEKLLPAEVQGMRLMNFRWKATPEKALAMIERIESLTRANLELTRRYDEQRLQEKRLENALRWIVDNPGAHPNNIQSVARSELAAGAKEE